MMNDIITASKLDDRLAALVDEAREYAQIYHLAKERKKGCEGTGELMTLREEFRDVIAKLVKHCGERGYPCGLNTDDPDGAAHKLIS